MNKEKLFKFYTKIKCFFIVSKKKKVFIQANCQSHVLRHMFQKLKRLNKKYVILSVKPVHLWQEKDQENIYQKAQECDIFLHQPIFESSFGEFSSDSLKEKLKEGVKIVSFPNLYFTGYHPQAFYLRDENGKKLSKPFDYHDKNILNFFKEGLKTAEILKKLESNSFYSEKEIKDNIEKSFETLRIREKNTDIKVSSYIEANMIGKKLFHVFNHPTNEMLFFLLNEILSILDEVELNSDEKNIFKKEMLGQVQYPVYPSVQKYFQLNEFRDVNMTNLQIKDKIFLFEEMTDAYIDFYKK